MNRKQLIRHLDLAGTSTTCAPSVSNRRYHLLATAFLACLASLLPTTQAGATPLNILYYGNSFLLDYHDDVPTVPELVAQIATAAGHATPNSINASVDAFGLDAHLAHNTAYIDWALSPGETWDFVVLQNYSTAPTRLGNLAQHRADSLALYQAVAAHSPAVVPVLLETWARGPGHAFYTGPTPDFAGGPAEMQQELRQGYLLAAQDIDAAVGSSLAKVAAVGDAWENAGFANLYDLDLYHPNKQGLLLSALVTYSTIYGDPHTGWIDLSDVLASLGLTSQDGAYLTSIVDFTVVPEPSGLAMLLVAVVSLALWRFRQIRRC